MRRHGSIKIQEDETKRHGLHSSLDHLHDELRYPLNHLRRVAAVEGKELEAIHEPLHPLFLESVQVPATRTMNSALVNCAKCGR